MDKIEDSKLRKAITEHIAENKDMSIEKLSEQIGITNRHLYYLMSGDKNPTLPVAKKIAEALGKTIDELF